MQVRLPPTKLPPQAEAEAQEQLPSRGEAEEDPEPAAQAEPMLPPEQTAMPVPMEAQEAIPEEQAEQPEALAELPPLLHTDVQTFLMPQVVCLQDQAEAEDQVEAEGQVPAFPAAQEEREAQAEQEAELSPSLPQLSPTAALLPVMAVLVQPEVVVQQEQPVSMRPTLAEAEEAERAEKVVAVPEGQSGFLLQPSLSVQSLPQEERLVQGAREEMEDIVMTQQQMAAEEQEAETQEELVDLPTVQFLERAVPPLPRPEMGQTAETNVIIQGQTAPEVPRPLVLQKQSVPGQAEPLSLLPEQCLLISLALIQPKIFPLPIKKLIFALISTPPTE